MRNSGPKMHDVAFDAAVNVARKLQAENDQLKASLDRLTDSNERYRYAKGLVVFLVEAGWIETEHSYGEIAEFIEVTMKNWSEGAMSWGLKEVDEERARRAALGISRDQPCFTCGSPMTGIGGGIAHGDRLFCSDTCLDEYRRADQ